jgi:ATP-dependent RNA helicase DeaD
MAEFVDLSKEDIIKRFAALEFNRFLDDYKNAPDLNAAADDRGRDSDRGERGERGERGPRGTSAGFTRLFINLGAVDEFTRGDLLGYICNNTGITGKSVGKIDMKGVFSFFEVETDLVEKVTEAFKPIDFHGRDVRIEVSGEATGLSEGGERRSSGGGERRSGGGGYGGGERRSGGGGYGGGERRSGGGGYGGGERRSSGGSGYGGGGDRRSSGGSSSGGGFRDFSGKRKDDGGGSSSDSGNRRRRS